MELLSNQMREMIASVQHRIWSQWMRYLFSVSDYNESGTLTIPADFVSRWEGQIVTEYCDLSEWEKGSERQRANKVLEAIEEALP